MIWKEGDPQKITFKLPDKRGNAFIRATIEKIGTPGQTIISLSHDERGKYSAIPSPALTSGLYSIDFEVFRDAGFTRPWLLYNDSSKELRVESIENTITTQAQNIIDLMDDSDGRIT